MARVSYAPFMGDIIGKLGNGVFQRGKAGPILRERVVPINVKSSAQIGVRNSLTTRSKAWAGLSEGNRTSWDTAAASAEWTQKNVFGENFQLSGEQLYLKLNLILDLIGESAITTPPTKATFDSITIGALTATVTGDVLTLAFTGTLSSDFQFMVSASNQVSQGVMSPKSISFSNITNTTGTTPLNIHTAYEAKYGSLVAGKKIFVRLEIASDLTGETILVGEVSAIVGA